MIICISGERVWYPLQENEAIFSKIILQNILDRIKKNKFLLTNSALLVVEGYFKYHEKGIDVVYKKIK